MFVCPNLERALFLHGTNSNDNHGHAESLHSRGNNHTGECEERQSDQRDDADYSGVVHVTYHTLPMLLKIEKNRLD